MGKMHKQKKTTSQTSCNPNVQNPFDKAIAKASDSGRRKECVPQF